MLLSSHHLIHRERKPCSYHTTFPHPSSLAHSRLIRPQPGEAGWGVDTLSMFLLCLLSCVCVSSSHRNATTLQGLLYHPMGMTRSVASKLEKRRQRGVLPHRLEHCTRVALKPSFTSVLIISFRSFFLIPPPSPSPYPIPIIINTKPSHYGRSLLAL